MQDVLNFTFQAGYFNIGNNVDVPEGVIIAPSSNVLYDKNKRLISYGGNAQKYAVGGTRSFVLDKNLVGFMGSNISSNKAFGNLIQNVGKSLWFVGNALTNGVKIYDINPADGTATARVLGGVRQTEKLTFVVSNVDVVPSLTYQSIPSNGPYDVFNYTAHPYVNGQPIKFRRINFSATFATDTFTATAHGRENGQLVRLTGTLPTGFSTSTDYYVVQKTNDTFKLSTTSGTGGTPVTGTGTGSNIRVFVSLDTGITEETTYYVIKDGADNFALGHKSQLFTADATTNEITCAGHGFVQNDVVKFEQVGTLPGNISSTTFYYIREISGDKFKISTTADNTGLVDISSAGSGANRIIGKRVTLNEERVCSAVSFAVPVKITSSALSTSPVRVWCQLNYFEADKLGVACSTMADAINSDSIIKTKLQAYGGPNTLTVYNKKYGTSDLNVETEANQYNIPVIATSTVVSTGSTSTSATLSTTPQYCKWNSVTSEWGNPIRVGLSEITDVPTLDLTTSATRGTDFSGLIIGSRSVRVARKRVGAVSIASPPSNIVTASETGDSLLVTIPVPEPDLSEPEDNSWLLYFTYSGLGSTSTHKVFPMEIPEAELSGLSAPVLRKDGNAKYKVVKQSMSSQDNRKIEIEFNDNDLVLIEPYEDYYPADPCKFMAKLGNVMCLIGAGDDSTGFDVSYPNSHEAYSPDWRDWFSEQPISLAQEQDMGFFWVCTANTTYIASWTGVTEGSAPVVIEKRSSIYGAIGEGATVCVNGLLYSLTSGKTPVVISPDGQVNDKFGASVKPSFSSFNDTTEVGWDEETNSVVFACGNVALAFQIDSGVWSAPISMERQVTGGTLPLNVQSVFSVNGRLHLCDFIAEAGAQPETMVTRLWNFDSSNPVVNWNVTSAFQFGQSGRSLKDIIKVEGVFSSSVNSGDITFKAYKNYNTSGDGITLTNPAITISATGSQITVRSYAESLDYDSVAARIDGTKGGQTVHLALYTVDVHSIERLA